MKKCLRFIFKVLDPQCIVQRLHIVKWCDLHSRFLLQIFEQLTEFSNKCSVLRRFKIRANCAIVPWTIFSRKQHVIKMLWYGMDGQITTPHLVSFWWKKARCTRRSTHQCSIAISACAEYKLIMNYIFCLVCVFLNLCTHSE